MWHQRLKEHLFEQAGARIELLNLGVPGTGPPFHKRLFELEGAALEPDVVLLAFFVGNDFNDNFRGTLFEEPRAHLKRASYLARLVRNLIRLRNVDLVSREVELVLPPQTGERQGGYEISAYRETYERRDPLFDREALMRIESRRVGICRRDAADLFERKLDKAARFLREMHDDVSAAGATFVVAILPDRYQVNDDEKAEVLALLGRRDEEFDWDRPQRRLREVLESEGIPYVDLLPVFHAEADRELCSRGDTHWSLVGNDLAARELVPLIARALEARETAGP
jgi:hypothetical protein